MTGLLDFLKVIAQGSQNGAFGAGMQMNIPGLRDDMMQPQQPQWQPPMAGPWDAGKNSLAYYLSRMR